MNSIGGNLNRFVIIVGLIGALNFVHSQTSAEAAQAISVSDADALQAVEATTPQPAESVPEFGTFYSAQFPDWPPLPGNIHNLPVWDLGDGFYLLADLDFDYAEASEEAQAEMALARASGLMLMDDESTFESLQFTTNDLWLEITGTTNLGSSLTAYLAIHPPWNVTNGVYGLYFKTNLAIPYNWTWLLASTAGQTNLVATNLPPTQGFFMLGDPTAIRPGFTNNVLAPSDDDYTGNGTSGTLLTNLLATIGFPINFFGASYTNLYVNNNGNVTFDDYLSAYTPTPLLDLGMNIVAPFWADVDTRGMNSGVVTYGTGTVDGRTAFGVNWIDVGYFLVNDDKLNSFQLVLIDRPDRTNEDFDLEFNYSKIQWETGDASGGSGGLGGSSARAGYASAAGSTFELNNSGTNGAFLDSNTTNGLVYTNFNSTVPGRYVFQFHNGVPLGTP